ncbi:Fic family protein [Fuscibacter oryzae]|uniref:Fic family protein n=1 Tax=Fuscibacter oryzae TaxID=2803939 RepID=UPI002E27F9C9|nr:Fic family protein [Fuscibacter oryzae]
MAAYAFGITWARAFVDGNKRTGFVAAVTFLRLSPENLCPYLKKGVRMMEDLASSAMAEESFAS